MDLTVFFEETSTGLRVSAEYSTELFDADRVERLLEHFGVLLEDASARPDRAVETVRLMGEQERHQVVHGFNRAGTHYDLDTPLPQLFERQAARTPDASRRSTRTGH